MAIFTDRIPSTQIESAEVVYGRDTRSRVRISVSLFLTWQMLRFESIVILCIMWVSIFLATCPSCSLCYISDFGVEYVFFEKHQTAVMLQGYGTVKFLSSEDAQVAIQECDGLELEGRLLSVKIDQWG